MLNVIETDTIPEKYDDSKIPITLCNMKLTQPEIVLMCESVFDIDLLPKQYQNRVDLKIIRNEQFIPCMEFNILNGQRIIYNDEFIDLKRLKKFLLKCNQLVSEHFSDKTMSYFNFNDKLMQQIAQGA